MRRLALIPVAALVLACNPPPASDVAQSGPPSTPAPEVLAIGIVRHDFTPSPTTTTTIAVTTPTAPSPVPTTVPVPVTAARPSQANLSDPGGSVHAAIAASFGSGQVAQRAQGIAECESRLNPGAVSPTDDHGLFQINRPTWNRPGHADPVADWIGRHWASVYDPFVNAEMARRIHAAYGWDMWACA